MPRREVIEYPDPRLRRQSERVTAFDNSLAELIGDLVDTLRATESIGLSAPQIGDFRQVLIVDLSEGKAAPVVYVNPEILNKSAWGLVAESCLSVPGVSGKVIRATEVRVRAQHPDGETFERDLEGMDAVCVQHEMDHLSGKLFVDRLSIFRRLYIRAFAGSRERQRKSAA